MNEALPMEDAMNETPKTDAPEMEQADAAAPGAAAQSAGAAEAEAAERRALAKSVAEALIFASPEPLAQKAIADRLPSGTDVEALLAEIARTRARGYSFDDEENEPDIRCIGGAILDRLGQAVGAVSLSIPLYRYDEAQADFYVARVRETVRGISDELATVV